MNTYLTQHIAELDEQVSALTGATQEQINEVRFELAYMFLEHVIGTDAWGMHELPLTPLFWTWWRREWARIDQEVVDIHLQYDHKLQEYYCTYPNGKEVRVSSARQLRAIWAAHHYPHPDNYRLTGDLVHASWGRLIKSIAHQNQIL